MSERLFDFFGEVFARYFGYAVASYPRLRRIDVETLLSDDTHRRVTQGRRAAVEWGGGEHIGNVVITSERLLITDRGLMYTAELNAPMRDRRTVERPLYYIATPPALFESIVDRVADTSLLPGSVAAVDNRLGRELLFPCPLDVALRRLLDAQAVLRMEPTETG
jgi:hypothetical protein